MPLRALTSGDPRCPAVAIRLAQTLAAVGHADVILPGCSECPGGLICQRCAARDPAKKRPCARCGVTARIVARRDEGGICSSCYRKDPQVTEECAGCGRLRMPAIRRLDSQPLCRSRQASETAPGEQLPAPAAGDSDASGADGSSTTGHRTRLPGSSQPGDGRRGHRGLKSRDTTWPGRAGGPSGSPRSNRSAARARNGSCAPLLGRCCVTPRSSLRAAMTCRRSSSPVACRPTQLG